MANKKISIDTTNDNLRISLTNKCNSCSHIEVCKYKEEFKKFIEDIKDKSIKVPKMFNLDITCSKYSSRCNNIIRTIDPTPQMIPLHTPGVVPAPNYTPGITPSITTPDLIPTLNPKVICEVNDGSINTINSATCGISGNKGTISLQG